MCRCQDRYGWRVTRKREIRSYLMDMDGVLVREEHAIPGADEFIAALRAKEMPFIVLTNNSIYTPRDLSARLRANGIDIGEADIWTSALATARFLDDQRPGGSAYVIGEAGLLTALHTAGYTMTESDPHHPGDPSDRGRGAVHRDQPGRHRSLASRAAAGDRGGRRADHQGHGH
jgi:ribonucleotide monophosphatase NagD (HAD superfamily)